MTPAPRENGWEELRREIEALHDDPIRFGSPKDASQNTARAVLAIVDRLAAARGEPPEPGPAINVERLARAMHRGRTVGCAWVLHKGERACQVEDHRPDAEAVAAEYDRLRP